MCKTTEVKTIKSSFNSFLVFLFLSIISTGCAKTIQAYKLPQEDLHLESARIYIFRPSPSGFLIKQEVYEDNIIAGQVGTRSFIGWDIKPGPTTLHGRWGFIKVLAQPGKTYYFKIYPSYFAYGTGGFRFTQVSEQQGKQYLENLKPPKINVVM